MKETKLKPCPFCGGEATTYSYDPFDGYQGNLTKYVISCTKCAANIETGSKVKSERMWNRRISDENY